MIEWNRQDVIDMHYKRGMTADEIIDFYHNQDKGYIRAAIELWVLDVIF